MSTLRVDAIRHNSATSDAITTAADGTCTAKLTSIGGGQLSHRNLIINGAMQVAQRGTSYTGTDQYNTVDRFLTRIGGVDENCTMEQVDVGSGTTPYSLGFRKSFKITNGNQTSGAGAGDYIQIIQRIEAQNVAQSGWNYVSSSSNITLSFWVRSSVAQNFYGYLRSIDGTGQLYPFETGSLTADTWTKITKTIPGNSNLTFDINNGEGLQFQIAQFWGTDYTDSGVSLNAWAAYASGTRAPDNTSTWYTTNDATFEITGVQLEVGDTATSFEHLSFGEELLRCYRYYYRLKGDNNKTYMIGMSDNDNLNIYGFFHFPVPMRIAPTALEQSGSASDYKVRRDTTQTCTAVPAFIDAMDFYCRVNFPRSSHGWGTGQMLWCQGGSSSSYLGFSAEI